jgi:hypothetical protein
MLSRNILHGEKMPVTASKLEVSSMAYFNGVLLLLNSELETSCRHDD